MKGLLVALLLMQLGDVKVPAQKLPDVPEKSQHQLQALLIKQQKTRLQEAQIAQMYKDAQAQDQQLGQEGLALEKQVLKDMNLNPDLYQIDERNGEFVVIALPNKTEKPASKP